MRFGFCNISHVPVRKTHTSKSEMVTQLLFGDTFEILDTYKTWLLIRNYFDNYEGWIDDKQLLEIGKESYEKINSDGNETITNLISYITDTETNLEIPIVRGSCIPKQNQDNIFEIEKTKFLFQYHKNKIQPLSITSFAKLYLNSPYLWGGKSPFGIDCSGFTQVVYRYFGINLLRDTNQQAEQGRDVSFISEAQPHDLAFFENDEGSIIHVGIILADNKIIHASGKVRIDTIDHNGIFNSESGSYSHKLKLIKKVNF